MAGAIALLFHPKQESVAVTVIGGVTNPLPIARRIALSPPLLPGPAPEAGPTGFERLGKALSVHPPKHQHLVGSMVLHDGGDQAIIVVGDGSELSIGGLDRGGLRHRSIVGRRARRTRTDCCSGGSWQPLTPAREGGSERGRTCTSPDQPTSVLGREGVRPLGSETGDLVGVVGEEVIGARYFGDRCVRPGLHDKGGCISGSELVVGAGDDTHRSLVASGREGFSSADLKRRSHGKKADGAGIVHAKAGVGTERVAGQRQSRLRTISAGAGEGIESGDDVSALAHSLIEGAFGTTDTTEVEAQHGDSGGGERFKQRTNHVVVPVAAELGVRVSDHDAHCRSLGDMDVALQFEAIGSGKADRTRVRSHVATVVGSRLELPLAPADSSRNDGGTCDRSAFSTDTSMVSCPLWVGPGQSPPSTCRCQRDTFNKVTTKKTASAESKPRTSKASKAKAQAKATGTKKPASKTASVKAAADEAAAASDAAASTESTGSPASATSTPKRSRAADGLPIKMMNDRILVSISDDDGERRSGGGILIPATAERGKRLSWAEVVAAGPNARTMELGDRVLFNPEDRYEVELQGQEYIILRERDIHAVAAPRLEDSGHGLYL